MFHQVCQSQYINLFTLLYCVCVCVCATRRLVCYLIDCSLCPCIYHIVCMYLSARVYVCACSCYDCYLIYTVCYVCVSQQPTPPHTARSAKPSPTLHPSFPSNNEKVKHTQTARFTPKFLSTSETFYFILYFLFIYLSTTSWNTCFKSKVFNIL